LGGHTNYPADRAAAEQVIQEFPAIGVVARENWAFMRRATRLLAERGVRNYLDIGTGIPTSPKAAAGWLCGPDAMCRDGRRPLHRDPLPVRPTGRYPGAGLKVVQPVDETLERAIAVCKRFMLAQDGYGLDDSGTKEVGLDELDAAWAARDDFLDELRNSGLRVDMDLAHIVAAEEVTGKKHPYVVRDEDGNPVALQPPRKLTAEQTTQAVELLADPKQTITGAARILGVSNALLYAEVPGVSGRPVTPRGRTENQRQRVQELVARANELLVDPEQTVSGVAKALGVSRVTLYNEIPGLADRPKAGRGGSLRQRQSADGSAAVTR